MKALHLRYFPAFALLVILAPGLARAGTLTANGAAIKPHEDAQPNACANPPCVYTPATAPPVNNDPNSEAGLRNKANLAKTNAPARPTRKSRVPEGSTFYFLLIGAIVFFFARFLFKGNKPAGR
jgi:hypothetical protein